MAVTTDAEATTNGHLVEHRIVVHLGGSDHELSLPDARQLRDALTEAVPAS